MLNCWNKDPHARPSFESLQEDFSDFDVAIEKKYYKDCSYILTENNYTNEFSRRKARNKGESKPKKGHRRREKS